MFLYGSLAIALVIVVVVASIVAWYFQLWLQAYATGTRISILDLFFMSLRQVSPSQVLQCKIMAVQSGLPTIATSAIEAQYLAGGDIRRVMLAVIAAERAGISLDWDTAAAIDLAGRDILEAVRTSVYPKVIICPDPTDEKSDSLQGVARDGIQLKVSVRVTVRTNLLQLIGGATESTVVARVGQSVISAIGSCDSYLEALCDPMLITRKVIAQGLDSQTAFSIVSIDIAEIGVGRNIGAKLQIDQADADFRVALALAEQRRAMAMAKQQEMKAKCVKSRGGVVRAEAEVPVAIAVAMRNGNIRTDRPATRPMPRRRFPHLPLLKI